MASSSSLFVAIPQTKYDVFVSFRGEDTRNNFTSHLDVALRRKQITTFIDDQLNKGDEISPSLMTAIEESDISVVVFSKQYASSRWCLDELVKILECKNNYGQIVIPVFYHVDPSHVRKQDGIFGESFSNLKERFQDKIDKLEIWKTALGETANLSGFHVQDNRPEPEFVAEIANNVLKRLNEKCRSHDIDNLIGVESIITTLESLLSTASTTVYTLGIWGIGGIGKTTIARVIFEKISNCFEGSCKIENVREQVEKIGLDELKQRLYSSLFENEKIDLQKGFCSISKRLKSKKVVVVLDDVTCFDQIESLIGSLDSFGDESRIIITTRDRKVLDKVNGIYEMKGLLGNNALTLFSRHAFGQNHPIIGFEYLSAEIIKYAGGIPLALKVLGLFLFGRKKEEWESAIKKLKKIPHKDIQKVLKISYDGLDHHDKNIFLDIVCFFKGWSKHNTIEFLDACGFSTEIAMKVLEEKCLIFISNNMITMHDLMQEMGKEIVRQESIDDSGKRSRLWHHEDIYEVLTYNTGTKAIQGISFNMSQVKETRFQLSTFEKMHKLRFLEFYGTNNCKMSRYRRPVFFELRNLYWDGYPLKSLPLHLHPEYLLSIKLRNSKIKKLWDGNQDLHNLKHIDLSFSKQLEKLPDLKNAPNLENLILRGCSSLVEIDISIQLNKLVSMDLRDCESLKSLPPRIDSKSLNYLLLSGCTRLMRFPDISSCNIEELGLDRIVIGELPSSIECLSRLARLNISNCSRLKQLPTSMCKLKSLCELCLSDCPNLQRLPDNLGHLEVLQYLFVERTPIRKIQYSIGSLHSLSLMKFSGCCITELPESLGQLSSLEKLCLSNCSALRRLPDTLRNLKRLCLLNVERTAIREVPSSIVHLHELQYLEFSNCKSLQALPTNFSIFLTGRMPSFEFGVIDLRNCFELDQNKLSKIVKKVVQNIQLTNTKRWEAEEIEDREEYHELCYGGYSGEICYPGSEIPEWFDFRDMGSSGSLLLPQDWPHPNLIGVVVCTIVSTYGEFSESSEYEDDECGFLDIGLWCNWKVNTKDGQWHRGQWYAGTLRHCDSDHLTLCYEIDDYYIFPKGFDECRYNNRVFIQFSPGKDVKFSVVVKKWGIHFLYSKDFGEFVKDYSSDEEEEGFGEFVKDYSSDEEEDANEEESKSEEKSNDEQEEPHPKRLKSSTSSF